MLKKIFIILTFVLFLTNIANVNTTTETSGNSTLKTYVGDANSLGKVEKDRLQKQSAL